MILDDGAAVYYPLGMSDQPHPFAYSHKDELFALAPAEQAPHIWECLQYLEWRRGIGDLPEEEIDKQVGIMRHIAQDAAKAIARRLQEEGAYKNRFDPRWRRFHPNSKNPLYLTGVYPALCMCLPDTDEAWNSIRGSGDGEDNFREFADWLGTPAGMHGFTDDQRAESQRMAAQYEQDVERSRKSEEAARKATDEFNAAHKELQQAIDAALKLRTKK